LIAVVIIPKGYLTINFRSFCWHALAFFISEAFTPEKKFCSHQPSRRSNLDTFRRSCTYICIAHQYSGYSIIWPLLTQLFLKGSDNLKHGCHRTWKTWKNTRLLRTSVRTWKSQGGMLKKHIGQGKVRDLFFGYSFLYTYNYYTLSEKNKLQKQYRGEYALS